MERAPKQYTNEEIAGMEKSRTISDAELLKGGAEYVLEGDDSGKHILEITDNQYIKIHEEMERDLKEQELIEQKVRDDFKERAKVLSIEDMFKLYPEIGEKIDLLHVPKGGLGVDIVRMQATLCI